MFGWLSWGLVMHCQWVWRLVAAWGALWDWLKVFRVGGAACGCSVGIGNPWQTLPLLLSTLMESEESLEVASVSSCPPQKPTQGFSTTLPCLLTLYPPGHSQPLVVTSHLHSVQTMLSHVNGFVITLNIMYLMASLHMHWLQSRTRMVVRTLATWTMTIHYCLTEGDLL